MSLVSQILAYGTLGLNLLLLLSAAAFIYNRFSQKGLTRFKAYKRANDLVSIYAKELAFSQALIATAGSLYMSNILGWTPCRLCWFQRIIIYPLVVILGVSILFGSRDVKDYVVPLTLIGIPISAYHYMIQRIEQFQAAGCSVTQISCSTEYTFYFDYITIPMMALTAQIVILALIWKFYKE